MLNFLERILDKLDAIEHRLNGMDKTLVKQEQNLDEHMRRSDLLEKKLAPVEKHVAYIHGAFKLIGVTTAILGLLKLLGLI